MFFVALQWPAMAHTYSSSLFHCIFSTKERRPELREEVQARLWAYMGGIAHASGKALAVGGAADHAHLLLSLFSTVSIAEAMRAIKASSSHWLRTECGLREFEWQEGYGAFSIGHTQIAAAVAYIGAQAEHHRKRDYQAEFLAILTKHEIAYDPRYVWG